MKSQVLHTVWCNISGEAAGGGESEIDRSWEWRVSEAVISAIRGVCKLTVFVHVAKNSHSLVSDFNPVIASGRSWVSVLHVGARFLKILDKAKWSIMKANKKQKQIASAPVSRLWCYAQRESFTCVQTIIPTARRMSCTILQIRLAQMFVCRHHFRVWQAIHSPHFEVTLACRCRWPGLLFWGPARGCSCRHHSGRISCRPSKSSSCRTCQLSGKGVCTAAALGLGGSIFYGVPGSFRTKTLLFYTVMPSRNFSRKMRKAQKCASRGSVSLVLSRFKIK